MKNKFVLFFLNFFFLSAFADSLDSANLYYKKYPPKAPIQFGKKEDSFENKMKEAQVKPKSEIIVSCSPLLEAFRHCEGHIPIPAGVEVATNNNNETQFITTSKDNQYYANFGKGRCVSGSGLKVVFGCQGELYGSMIDYLKGAKPLFVHKKEAISGEVYLLKCKNSSQDTYEALISILLRYKNDNFTAPHSLVNTCNTFLHNTLKELACEIQSYKVEGSGFNEKASNPSDNEFIFDEPSGGAMGW